MILGEVDMTVKSVENCRDTLKKLQNKDPNFLLEHYGHKKDGRSKVLRK
jgi:hypothetical protein